MLNTDVIEVFDQVEVGTPVVIRCGGLLLGMLWFCDGFSGVRLVCSCISTHICCSLLILPIFVKAVMINECHVFVPIHSDFQTSLVVRVGFPTSFNSNWCIFSVLAILLMVN